MATEIIFWKNKCIVCKKVIKFDAKIGHSAFKKHIEKEHPSEFKKLNNIVKEFKKLMAKDNWLFEYW